MLGVFALLMLFGLLMVLSSSAVESFTAGGSSFSVFANQRTFAARAAAFCLGLRLPPRSLRSLAPGR